MLNYVLYRVFPLVPSSNGLVPPTLSSILFFSFNNIITSNEMRDEKINSKPRLKILILWSKYVAWFRISINAKTSSMSWFDRASPCKSEPCREISQLSQGTYWAIVLKGYGFTWIVNSIFWHADNTTSYDGLSHNFHLIWFSQPFQEDISRFVTSFLPLALKYGAK